MAPGRTKRKAETPPEEEEEEEAVAASRRGRKRQKSNKQEPSSEAEDAEIVSTKKSPTSSQLKNHLMGLYNEIHDARDDEYVSI
jgi:hypothetical protein